MVERIRFILNVYSLWITNHQQQRHQVLNHGIALRELIEDRLSASYNYTHFLVDYRRICESKRDLVGDHEGCDVEQCAVIGRNSRNRAFYGKNDSMRNKLYFVETGDAMKDGAVDEEEIARNIATQQILDSLHSYFYHTVHLNEDERKEIIEQKGNDHDGDDIDFETLCDDHSTEKLVNLMDQKRIESNRFRSRGRGNGDNNDAHHGENQKFMTTNDCDAASNSTFSAVYGTRRQRCFRDVFVSEMERYGVSKEVIETLDEVMEQQRFDTDAIVEDCDDVKDSNLIIHIHDVGGVVDDQKDIGEIAQRLALERKVKASLYSPGVRYFYWEKYKGNMQKRRKVFRHITPVQVQDFYEENEGYTLGQWYVAKKYENLKEELLNNLVRTLSAGQFACTLQKAMDKLTALQKSGKQPRCLYDWWADSYGIQKDQEISVQHVVAILLYTNFSELCYLFSATYRKMHEYESDEDMKARHSEYAIWARLLREAVECFGTPLSKSEVKVFYHGVSSTLILNSSSIKLCGPVSTTASMISFFWQERNWDFGLFLNVDILRVIFTSIFLFRKNSTFQSCSSLSVPKCWVLSLPYDHGVGFHIAATIFGEGGLVLSFDRIPYVDSIYFDCCPWSDYVEEDENLFLGGLEWMNFTSILNMSTTPVQNYKFYVQAMTMFDYIIEALPWEQHVGVIKKSHAKTLRKLIDAEIKKHHQNPSKSAVPSYILLFWHHFLANKERLQVDWEFFTEESEDWYSHLGPVLSNGDSSGLDLVTFLRILPNIRSLYTYKCPWPKFEPCCSLDSSFNAMLLSAVQLINETQSRCTSINIVCPGQDIGGFIEKYGAAFKGMQWCLLQRPFQEGLLEELKPQNDTLCVVKME